MQRRGPITGITRYLSSFATNSTESGILISNGCLSSQSACRYYWSPSDGLGLASVEPDDDEGIEQAETESWNNEQVHGGNVRRVVTQEGPPSLAGRPPPFDHVLGDARLRDLKPELESSPWVRGAPQSGFSTLIRRINARSSVSIRGRRPNGRDFQRQLSLS
jgi:hypothetical protein